mmetsp:Transcript_105697/g.340913  ORF Transcript_105697/g.340913 Transcript_105697/m.340913 type:complete len:123 (-) Transcript_105697:270-638(-)
MADARRLAHGARKVRFGACEVVLVWPEELCAPELWEACEPADAGLVAGSAEEEDESKEAFAGKRLSSERLELRAARRCATPRAGCVLPYNGPLLQVRSRLWQRRRLADPLVPVDGDLVPALA